MAGYKTEDDSALAPNDPYRNMEKAETRPDLHVIEEGKAKSELAAAEKSAASPIRGESARNLEMAQPTNFGFRNSVRGVSAKQAAQNGKKPGWFKRKGPIAAISTLILGGAALIFGGTSLLGPHLSALYTEATDVQYTSYSMRNQRMFKFMMDGGDQIAITPFSRKFTTFTPYMKSRLAKNGIEVGHLNSSGGFESGDLMAGRSRVLRYNGEVISANDFQTKYASDVNFRDAYYKAKRGRVAGFFDDASEWFYKKMGMSRNIFDDYRSTGDTGTDDAEFRSTISDRVQGTDGELNTASDRTDDNGTPDDPSDDTTTRTANGEDIRTGDVAGDTPQAKARTMVNDLAGKVAPVAGPACAAMRVANMVAVAVAANQIFQSANYFMGMMENVSKTMYGEGNGAALNEVLNFLSTTTTNEVEYTDENGTVTKTVTGSALESSGSKLVLGGIIPIEYEVGAYSLDNITNAALMATLVGGGTMVGCSLANAAGAVVSLAAIGIPGGALAKWMVGMLMEAAGGIVITGIVAGVVSAIVPMVAKALFTDIFENYTGKPAGELFTQGAATANFQVAQTASAYMPASEERLTGQNRNTAVALAQEAEVDRNSRSPFDVTSKNTFLGSLVASFLPTAASTSVSSSAYTFMNVLGNAVSRILPTASAEDQGVSYTTQYKECTNLKGAMCDVYGFPIPASDYGTIDIEPDDPTYERVIMANMEDDATTIKDNSELAKFITFCANRESPWGVTDANILNALQTDYGVILNNLPFLNDVIDLVNAAEDTANLGWATGERCMNSADNPYWDGEYRYYQRFIEDTRILAGMGAYEEGGENPVLGYLERYDEAHPLDTSYEGTLARMMGYTRDDVAFMLEFIEYSQVVADYDPDERYIFGGENSRLTNSEEHEFARVCKKVYIAQCSFKNSLRSSSLNELGESDFFTGETQSSSELSGVNSLITHRVIYADTRNRSFAV